MRFIITRGTDAGYWYIDANGVLHHVGGWGTDRLTEFSAAVSILREAVNLKTPGLAEAAIKSVLSFAESQIKEHVKDTGAGPTVILVG
jgi:hypothetical protein